MMTGIGFLQLNVGYIFEKSIKLVNITVALIAKLILV